MTDGKRNYPAPDMGRVLYFDDWWPIIGPWSGLYLNPLRNGGYYDAGVRLGPVMVHKAKGEGPRPYFFGDLQNAADRNLIGSQAGFEDFVEDAKIRYELYGGALDLLRHLNLNNKLHCEIFRVVDEQFLKMGLWKLPFENRNSAAKDLWNAWQMLGSVAGTLDVFDESWADLAVVLSSAEGFRSGRQSVTTTRWTMTFASEESISLQRKGDAFEVRASRTTVVASRVDITSSQWFDKNKVRVAGLTGQQVGDVVKYVAEMADAADIMAGVVKMASGMQASDENMLLFMEGWSDVAGVAAGFGPGFMFSFYSKGASAAREMIGDLKKNKFSRLNLLEVLVPAARGGTLNWDAITGCRGDEGTPFSTAWFMKYSSFIREHVEELDRTF